MSTAHDRTVRDMHRLVRQQSNPTPHLIYNGMRVTLLGTHPEGGPHRLGVVTSGVSVHAQMGAVQVVPLEDLEVVVPR